MSAIWSQMNLDTTFYREKFSENETFSYDPDAEHLNTLKEIQNIQLKSE